MRKLLNVYNRWGVKMYKQQLTKTFKRPFYCGIINHGLLDSKVLEGRHEKLVSHETFLKANEIHIKPAGFGVPHKKKDEYLLLKSIYNVENAGSQLPAIW